MTTMEKNDDGILEKVLVKTKKVTTNWTFLHLGAKIYDIIDL